MFWLAMFAGCNAAVERQTPPSKPASNNQGLVVSGSMEPSLPGPVRLAQCLHCGRRSAFGVSGIDLHRPVPCLACGHDCTWTEKVLLEPVEWKEEPAREPAIGDIVKFLSPDRADDPTVPNDLPIREELLRQAPSPTPSQLEPSSKEVKRVAGLPGDLVEIRGGDLWVHGKRFQKGAEFLQQAILVHSDKLPSASEWQPWIDPNQTSVRPSLLFASRRWERQDGLIVSIPSPIQDDWWFNQGERIAPRPVPDLGVVLHFSQSRSTDVKLEGILECWQEPSCQRIVFHQQGDQLLWHCEAWDGEAWLASSSPQAMPLPMEWLAMAWIDGRCLVAQPNKVQFQETPSMTPNRASEPDSSPISYLAPTTPLRLELIDPGLVKEKWVIRDIYYRVASRLLDGTISPVKEPHSASVGYVLLGDNVALSDDSRTRWEKGVTRDRILGVMQPDVEELSNLWRQRRWMRWSD